MPEPNTPKDLWRNQPMDSLAVNFERLVDRRAREFDSATRSEVLTSIGAVIFFASVMVWRFGSSADPLPRLGLAAMVLWAVVAAYWFRRQIWPQATPPGALAATGLAHYRTVLERRRKHIKNDWTWRGPLIFMCLILFQVAFPGFARLKTALPLLVFLLVWIILRLRIRQRNVAEIQRELDELEDTHPTGNLT